MSDLAELREAVAKELVLDRLHSVAITTEQVLALIDVAEAAQAVVDQAQLLPITRSAHFVKVPDVVAACPVPAYEALNTTLAPFGTTEPE